MDRRAMMLASLIGAATFLAGAADNRESRVVGVFSAIDLAAPVKMEVRQGPAPELVLEGDPAYLAQLESTIENGVLRVRVRPGFHMPWTSPVRAYVTLREVGALTVSGSGSIRSSALQAPQLKLAVSGSGGIGVDKLASTNLRVIVSGSGDVSLAGAADSVTVSISGSGNLRAAQLQSRASKVSVAGSGDASVWADESLAVKVAGSGDVTYRGNPKVEKSIAGSGSVRRASAAS
jgi:hypothetical protein